MTFYSCIILLLLFLSIGKVKKIDNITILKIVMFFLWLLASTRTLEVGSDTKPYYTAFYKIAACESFKSLDYSFEIGYLVLSKLVSWIKTDYWFFLAVENAIVFYAYYLLFKRYSVNPIMSVFLFFVFGTWGQTMNIIRQQLAIAMTIYAFLFREDKKNILCFVFLVLSVCFHRIAVVHFIAFFVPKKLSRKFSCISLFIAVAALLFLPLAMKTAVLIVPKYASYLTAERYSFGEVKAAVLISVLLRTFLLVFILYIHKRDYSGSESLIAADTDIAYQFNMVFLSVMFLIAALRFHVLDRCSYYYWTFAYILIPNVIGHMKEKHNKVILYTAFFAIGIAYFFVIGIYRPYWNVIYPYQSILLEGL